MRVLADNIASSALSSDHNQRPTTKRETMTTNPQLINDAMWHRGALDLKHLDGAPVNAPPVRAQGFDHQQPSPTDRPSFGGRSSLFTRRPSLPTGQSPSSAGQFVSLEDVMLHSNRILHNSDGFERDHYLKEMIMEEGGSSGARRDSLGSPSDLEQPNMLDTIMQHQNRILHHSDGFLRNDYLKEKSSTTRHSFDDGEGSSIFS